MVFLRRWTRTTTKVGVSSTFGLGKLAPRLTAAHGFQVRSSAVDGPRCIPIYRLLSPQPLTYAQIVCWDFHTNVYRAPNIVCSMRVGDGRSRFHPSRKTTTQKQRSVISNQHLLFLGLHVVYDVPSCFSPGRIPL